MRNTIDVFIVWFVVVIDNPHTFEPDLDRDEHCESFTLRGAEEALAEWMASDVLPPENFYYAYIEETSRYDP